ncbi:MAG: methyl-accepting chemotaxis protein [Nitrospirota bacterium]|nr:methyl-accepting chemotaxis protein [Nitrospirota bacterium]
MVLGRIRNTLVTQFTAIILLILVVGQGGLYTWLLLYQRAYLETSLRRDMTAVARQIGDTITRQNTDQRSLEQFLDLVLGTGSVLSVRVIDGTGRELVARTAPRSKIDAGSGTSSSRWLFSIPSENTLRVPLRTDGGAGAVEVIYSGRTVNEVMGRFLVIPPVMQTITFLVVIYAIARFFRSRVSFPVASINAALSRITEGDLVAEVPPIAGTEIGSIATGARFLAEKLSSTLARVDFLSKGVAAALERLTASLAAVRDSTHAQAESINSVMSVILKANEQQRSSTESTDRLSRVSYDNVTSLLEMRSAADEIASSTDRLFRSAADAHAMISAMSQASAAIADSTGEVFRAMESTSTSVEEISASLTTVRENARQSAEFSARVRQLLTERGTLAVADAVEAMEKIADEVGRFQTIVEHLDTQSKDIENVLSVINEVTERTNLLSLNASILASQAGEHGRGFAVVAGEIRSLSEGTAASAKDIAGIVKAIQSQIREAVTSIRAGVKLVEQGKDLIFKSGEAMGETLEAAQKTAQMTTAVEKATVEQAGGLKQIRSAAENVRLMLEQVMKNTNEERRNASRMLDSIREVKEVAQVVRKGTGEHASGTQVISRNLEESRDMVTRVHQAAQDQLGANEEIAGAVEMIKRAGVSAMKDLEEITRSFSALRNEVEDLKHEMAAFRTKQDPARRDAPK